MSVASVFSSFLDIGKSVGGDLLSFGASVFDFFSESGIVDFAGDLFLEGINIKSAQEAAEAALDAGESGALIFDENANLLEDEADRVRFRTRLAIDVAQFNGAKQMSRQITQYLKAGVTLEGSPLLVLDESKDIIEFEISRLQEEGFSKAENLERQAEIETLKADNAIDAATFKAETVVTQQLIQSGNDLLGVF